MRPADRAGRAVVEHGEQPMRIKVALRAASQGLALALVGYAASLTLFILATLSIAYIAIGVGLVLTPPVLTLVRSYTDKRRQLAAAWTGVPIPSPYQPAPAFAPGVAGHVQRITWQLKDPATWRDLLWLLVDSTAGMFLAALAASLFLEGLYGLVLAAGVWRPIAAHGGDWYLFVHVTNQTSGIVAACVGVALIILGIRYSPAIMRAHAELTRTFLAPSETAALTQRVHRLTETRHEAVDASAAELRRIERDLHDGAQARLVAMGLDLGAIERLMETDPDRAKRLLASVRESSAEALTELRELVRGIHPPVLAERGLADAVRALALRGPLRTEVVADLPDGRFEAPVEAAAYFAVSEVLANAGKHSGGQRAWIDMRHQDGMLRITVTDDGHGGADVAKGTGLRGIERRLATFDGVLALNSPQGGPTMVTLELPCVLSSPRTSSC